MHFGLCSGYLTRYHRHRSKWSNDDSCSVFPISSNIWHDNTNTFTFTFPNTCVNIDTFTFPNTCANIDTFTFPNICVNIDTFTNTGTLEEIGALGKVSEFRRKLGKEVRPPPLFPTPDSEQSDHPEDIQDKDNNRVDAKIKELALGAED